MKATEVLNPYVTAGARALGGTSFCGANLTHANFNQALLKGTNFSNCWEKPPKGKRREWQTILDWVCWQNAKGLDFARMGDSALANPAIRDLLVSRDNKVLMNLSRAYRMLIGSMPSNLSKY